jgi:hypothetical protein
MVSTNRNEYTVSSVYIYTRAFISKENGVEMMNFMQMYFAIQITVGLIATLVVIGWFVMTYVKIKREGK